MLTRIILYLTAVAGCLAQQAVFTRYWTITSPTADLPWVLGQQNYVAFITGGDTGVQSFDVQLHNTNKTIMNGFLRLALLVPLERLGEAQGNYGAVLEVDLEDGIPTGDGFSLIFLNSLHGQVYAKSKKFSIYPAAPSNYSAPGTLIAAGTATLDSYPDPTEAWAVTLTGVEPGETTSAQQIAGNVGSN